MRGFGGYEWVKGPYPPDHVGQGYGALDQQRAWGLKDARLTSTELALSALETLRGDVLGVRPHDAGTAAAAVAGNANLDSGASNGVTVPDQTAAALASSPPPDASPPTNAGTAAVANSRAANPQVPSRDQRIQQAVSYFQTQGWSRQQAIGIVPNLDAESEMNSDVHQRGGGPGYGLAQWENPRQRIFQQWAGHDIHGSTFEEQLQFIQYELTHVRPGAGRALRHAATAADAASIVTRLYEGPKDTEGEAIRRAERARQIEARMGR